MRYFSKDQLERAKLTIDIVAILFVLLVVIAVLFWFPTVWTHVREKFAQAGVRVDEVSVFGVVKIKAVDTLSVAQSALGSLQKDYETSIELLQCASAGTCTPEQQSRIDAAIAAAPEVVGTAGLAQEQIGQVIAKADETTQAQVPGPSSAQSFDPPGGWIAVTAADRELSSALFEEEKLISEYGDVAILLVDGWYRTVVFFGSEAGAKDALGAIKTITGRQPYVRRFSLWCPDAQEQQGFIACGPAS